MSKKKKKMKIVIEKKSGHILVYLDHEFTDYEYMDGLFIVLRGMQWIGIYNTDCIDNIKVVRYD